MEDETNNIDISKLNKADVLAALYNGSKPIGLGFLQHTPEPMTRDQAEDELEESRSFHYGYFDYLKGRVMKVDISGDDLNPRLYDRDLGEGAAARALADILEAGG